MKYPLKPETMSDSAWEDAQRRIAQAQIDISNRKKRQSPAQLEKGA